MIEICIYGKPNCQFCDNAKDKLDLMGMPFTFYNLDSIEEWKGRGKPAAMAEYALTDKLPIIKIEGRHYTYTKAMKVLKSMEKKNGEKLTDS